MIKEYLVSANEMKQFDNNTINKTGIPSMVLMERAALEVVNCVKSYLSDFQSDRILVVAGNGNNGADGICAGRILKEYGYRVDICLLNAKGEYTEEIKLQKRIASAYGISFFEDTEVILEGYKVVIDAIFGIGLNRDIEGVAKNIINRINESDCYIISVDIPSGINATTGEVCNVAIKADETVTFGFYKCGQMFFPGREYCGKITKALIGIDESSFYGKEPSMFTYIGGLQDTLDMGRKLSGNKGDFGKVLVIAGREATTGAALLCATSALKSGCGMVAVYTQEDNKEAFLAAMPEIMVETYADNDSDKLLYDKLDKWLKWADVCVIGCGLLKDSVAYKLLMHTVCECKKTIVADADALTLFAAYDELKKALLDRKNDDNYSAVIFTPHLKELATLAHITVDEVKCKRIDVVREVCNEYGVILAAKDADTLCMSENEMIYLNTSGNDGMATAGSGDVLAGLIGSFLAQARRGGLPLFEAVCLAIYVHGLAGDYMADTIGKSFMVASDIIEAYKYILS